ncbi:hypothetical protein [Silvanigrella sp.]|jgi:hypothetical protein|uniref:hypothetical protein n=1 Tax=Silvanigrella sp. TaxID=2024976 RepID=UPI0037CAB98F
MILCSYCNINIADDGGKHTCLPLINKVNQVKAKYSSIHRIMNQFLKSGTTNNADLYYDSILRYSVQDYKMTNPLLRKDYKLKFSEFLKTNLNKLDLIETVKCLQHLVPADQLINETIKENFDEVSGVTQTKKIIKDLFNFPTFSDQNYLLRGVTLPNYNNYSNCFKNFTTGFINKAVITEKAFTSTSTSTPLDNELLLLIFLDSVFNDHQAKNIKSSTKFKTEDEVLFFPESRFVVSYFCDIDTFPKSMFYKISPNLGKKFKYVAVLVALPLYYNETNFEKTQFIQSAVKYWTHWTSETTLDSLALRDPTVSKERKEIIKTRRKFYTY